MVEIDLTDDRLTGREKSFLLDLARKTIAATVEGQSPPNVHKMTEFAELSHSGRLTETRGVFVTLTAAGALRGCIGYIEGIKPLVDAIIDNSCNAAKNDPRFRPVQPTEIDNIDIEISALTPLREVADYSDIRVGQHGILLNKSGQRAVFLPQVATEQGWDLETTLTHLALKAGLGADSWRDGAKFEVFEAEVF